MAVGDNDEVIEEAVVEVGSELERGFAQKLQAKIDKALRGIDGNVKLVADTRGFSADVRSKLAAVKTTPTFKVRLVADATGFSASVRQELAKYAASHTTPEYKVRLVADADVRGAAKTGARIGAAAKNAASKAAGGGGGGGGAVADDDEGDDLKKAQAYLLGLRTKYIKDSLRLVRNGNEQLEVEHRRANDEEFKLTLDNLVKRFDLQRNGAKATVKAVQDADAELGRSLADIGKRFDLQRGGNRATAQRSAEALATQKRDAISRQRNDETFVNFQRGVRETLAKIAQGRAEDEISIREDTNRRVDAIGKAGLSLRTAVLSAEDTVEKRATQNLAANARERTRILNQQGKALRSLKPPQLIDYGGQGIRPMNALLGTVAALSPALIAMASSAAQASTSLVALGAAGIGTALSIGGLFVAFNGLQDLLALRKTAQAEATQESANSAILGLQNRQAELSAQNNLLDAINAQRAAEKDLHDSRVQAARDLENLKQKVADLQNQEKEDSLSVAEAESERDKTNRNFFATDLMRRRAEQNVANAKTRLAGTQLDRKQNREDLATSIKKGVEGSDKVSSAKERARQARNRVAETQLANKVQTAGGTAAKASSAQANLNDKLAKASPALREMFYWIDKNQAKFDAFARQIQQAYLPGFNQLLELISTAPGGGQKSTLAFFVDESAELGEIISKYAGKFGEFTNSALFRSSFATIQGNNATALDKIGSALLVIQKPLLLILAAASPLLVRFADGVAQFADWLDVVIDKASKSGALDTFFAEAGDQFGRWMTIGKNLLTILGDLMKASLPSGTSLVQRFADFTGEIAMWTGSDIGQAKIKSFFDFFKNLDYAEIVRFFTAAGELFLSFRTARFALANPFLTALGVLAASHPTEALKLMEGISEGIIIGVGFLASHPAATTALLTMLAYAKLRKSFGLDLRIPAIDSLKSALTSRFSTLDKLFGGESATGTMNVRAAVVNIYGGTGFGSTAPGVTPAVPGKPGSPTVISPGPATTEKGGKVFSTPGVKTALASIGIAGGALVGQYLVSGLFGDGEKGSVKEGLNAALSGGLNGALIGATFGGPVGAAIGAAIGAVAAGIATGTIAQYDDVGAKRITAIGGAGQPFSAAQGEEAKAFTELNRRVTANTDLLGHNNAAAADGVAVLQDYINARRTSVTTTANYVRSTQGEVAATKYLNTQNEISRKALADLLVQVGWNRKAAEEYAKKVYGVRTSMTNLTVENGKLVTALSNSGQVADATKDKFNLLALAAAGGSVEVGDLKTTLDKITGKKTITLEVNGQDIVFKSLQEALTYQRALLSGLSLQAAGQAVKRDQEATRRGVYGHAADGGLIDGYSPHPKADNIPTMLTANEYVQPVDAVKHYGVGFMEAIRTKSLPRYAEGGLVGGRWPFKVDVSKTLIPQAQAVTPGNVAAVTGDAAKLVGGSQSIAEIAEATARAMGATTKQLIALIEAGIVESHLHNLSGGDRDSLGFLQQRPSQGWGTPKQIMDPAYATRKFIEKARRVDSDKYDAGQLAQAVQRSAYPLKYGQQYSNAVAIINANAPYLTGAGVGSVIGGVAGELANVTPYAGKIAPDLGSVHNVSQAMYQAIVGEHGAFPQSKVISSYRRGAHTVSGNLSYHARNPSRAADFGNPSMALFNYFASRYGSIAKEIIYSPANNAQIYKGKPHLYSGDVRKNHFNHVHLALANGGQVRKYDTGGVLPPGFTMAYNGTGRNETIRTAKQEQQITAGPVRLHPADIALLARGVAAAASPTVAMDGRKVAEITNAYTYLPAGV